MSNSLPTAKKVRSTSTPSKVKSSKRRYAEKDLKLLWGNSGNRCAKCKTKLTERATSSDPDVVIGEIAHIVGASDDGPRADKSLAVKERDKYPNLILLCPTCHAKVDNQPNTYSVAELRKWKRDHEDWVEKQLQLEIVDVTFTELMSVTQAIVANPIEPNLDFNEIPPAEKLAKNLLSHRSSYLLQMGIGKAPEVDTFVQHMALMDYDFPERLRAGFIAEYARQRSAGLRGDALFTSMHTFSASGSSSFAIQAAGLAVLAYLFVKCEVFEK